MFFYWRIVFECFEGVINSYMGTVILLPCFAAKFFSSLSTVAKSHRQLMTFLLNKLTTWRSVAALVLHHAEFFVCTWTHFLTPNSSACFCRDFRLFSLKILEPAVFGHFRQFSEKSRHVWLFSRQQLSTCEFPCKTALFFSKQFFRRNCGPQTEEYHSMTTNWSVDRFFQHPYVSGSPSVISHGTVIFRSNPLLGCPFFHITAMNEQSHQSTNFRVV